jgi:hypothetical protein
MQCNCLKYNYLIFRTPHKILFPSADMMLSADDLVY